VKVDGNFLGLFHGNFLRIMGQHLTQRSEISVAGFVMS